MRHPTLPILWKNNAVDRPERPAGASSAADDDVTSGTASERGSDGGTSG
jgi:hypothetical protein